MAEPTAAAVAYGLDRGTQGHLRGVRPRRRHVRRLDPEARRRRVRGEGDGRRLRARRRRPRSRDRAADARASSRRRPIAARSSRRAVAEARRVKEALTDAPTAIVTLAARGCVDHARRACARVAQPLLDRCGKACRRVLKDAELTTRRARRRDPRRRLDALAGRARLRARAVRQGAARAISIPIRSSRSARRSRPTCSRAASRRSCCSMSCRCRSASR